MARILLVSILVLACGAPADPPPAPDAGAAPAAASSDAAPALASVAAPDEADTVTGIDVSHYSGTVDWSEVEAAGYRFAYVKASEGVDDPDPTFPQHWQELAGTDLRRGAYHLYVTEDDPEAQAQLFLSTVSLASGDLVPVVDIESLGKGTEPGLPDRLRQFLEILEGATGARPMIYTGPDFWDADVAADFGAYRLWIAEVDTDEPRLPQGWTEWTLWQWEINTTVPGVEKDVDVSRLHPEVRLEDLLIP